jgi:hypothetical protein
LQIREGNAEEEVTGNNTKSVLLKPRHPRSVLRGGAPKQHRATAASSNTPGDSGRSSHKVPEGSCALTPTQTASNRSVTLPLDNMLRIVTVMPQFMTEFNGAVSEEEKTMAIK